MADRSIFIGYKDEDPLNIISKNLILTNPSTTITKAYQKNHRFRECFGNKAMTVTQYNLTGKKICTYQSASEAENLTGIDSTTICEALKKKHGYGLGYIWRRK